MMGWLFWSFVGAAIVHIVEEYKYPGGFPDAMKRSFPSAAAFVTPRFAIIVNGLFLALCVAGAIVADRNLVFSLSVASLVGFNALLHLGGTIKARRYMPGVISGVLLYLPLSLFTYSLFLRSGQITPAESALSGLLGVLYHAVPAGYLAIASTVKPA